MSDDSVIEIIKCDNCDYTLFIKYDDGIEIEGSCICEEINMIKLKPEIKK